MSGIEKLFRGIVFRNKGELLYCLFFSFALFIGFTPYFTWNLSISALGLSSMTIAFLAILKFKKNNLLFLGFGLLTVLYVLMAVRGNYSIGGAIVLLLIVPIFYMDPCLICKIYKVFVIMFSVLLLISFIIYILVVLLDIPIPGSDIEPLNQLKTYIVYTKYPFLVVADSYNFLKFRFAGYFDEPGVVGTISAVCLLTNKFNMKKWYNIILLICGLFSMSLFFIGVSFFYFFMVASPKAKIIVVIIASVLVCSLWDNEVVSMTLFNRFFDEGGTLSLQSNRTHLSESWYNKFSCSYDYWIGLGQGAHFIYDEGGSSYKDIIIDYGAIFLFLYVLGFVIAMFKYGKSNNNKLIYVFVLISVIYQRPFIENVSYVFLLLSPLFVLSNVTEKNNNHLKLCKTKE